MFNFKISGIAAGAAFILSFIIGLFSGTGILVLLLRAFIFAVIFFVLSFLVFWLLAQFMPELLGASEDELGFPSSGSRVDISLGDDSVTGAFPRDNSDNVDDIAGRPSTPAKTASLPLDQGMNAGYNYEEGIEGDLEAADGSPNFGFNSETGKSGKTGSAELLPDIDNFTEETPGSAADVVNTGSVDFDSSTPRRPLSSSRKPGVAGDYNPKELAQAIQTVLKKDEKG